MAINIFSFSFAVPQDAVAVKQLLLECGLPVADIDAHLANFIVAKAGTGTRVWRASFAKGCWPMPGSVESKSCIS